MGLDDFMGAILPVAGGIIGSYIPVVGTMAGAAIGAAAGAAFFPPDQPSGGGYASPGAVRPAMPYGGYQDPLGGFVGYGDPNIYGSPTPTAYDPTQINGEVTSVALPAAGPVIMGLTRTLALTISKLAGRLGIAILGVSGLSRVGARIWRSLFTFARRHPNISVLSMLTALGLTVQEASEFIAWGSTRRRRRRGGISSRDMRVARRVIRRIRSFQSDLGGMRRGGGRFARGGGGVSVVRAG